MTGTKRPLQVGLAAAIAAFAASELAAGVNRWTTQGPLTGQVNALAAHPADFSRVFAATTAGGVFRSFDGGASWESANRGIEVSGFPVPQVFSIAIDPANPSTVYVGTDFGGVFKSLDGGDHWEAAADGLSYYGTVVNDIAIDPAAPSTLYAATLDGVFKSTDGACHWEEANTGLPEENDFFYTDTVVLDPADPEVLYLGTNFAGAYKSTDAAASWFPISTGLLYPQVAAIAFDPANPSRLLASNDYFPPDVGGGGGTIVSSDDAGAHWAPSNTGLPDLFFTSILFDPDAPSTVWAGSLGAGLFRSLDGGASWSGAGVGLQDSRVISLLPLLLPTETLLAGTFTLGVYRSTNEGGTWVPSSAGLHASANSLLAVAPSDPNVVYGAGFSFLGGISRSDDAGQSWLAAGGGLPVDGIGVGIGVDPLDPLTAYGSVFVSLVPTPAVFKTSDGGSSWSPSDAGIDGDIILRFSIDPAAPAHVLAGGNESFYYSLDSGTSWTAAVPRLLATNEILRDAGAPGRILILSNGSLHESIDDGQSFAPFGTGLEGTLPFSLAQDPSTPATLYCGALPGFFRSTDGGASWLPLGNLNAFWISSVVVDPSTPTTLHASAPPYFVKQIQQPGAGVLRSVDSGQTWSPFNRGIEERTQSSIGPLRFAGPGRLLAASQAGIYEQTFSATAPPAPASVDARSGPVPGGAAVTILGADFMTGARVFFDDAEASDVAVVDSGMLTAATPPGSPGPAAVRVVNPDTQFEILERGYVYDYTDAPEGSAFHDSVIALTLAGVTAGCGGGAYCPDDSVTRAQMAVLFQKTVYGPDDPFPKPGSAFSDVDPCRPEAGYIVRLAADGVTVGCEVDAFCPESPLTRAQASVWLLKGRHGSGYMPPPATGTVFTDVAPGDFAAAWIEQLAAEGLTAGCGDGAFCPDAEVSRGQAAAFLDLAFLQP